MGLTDRIQHAWNALSGPPETDYKYYKPGEVTISQERPYAHRTQYRIPNERSLVASIYNRMAIDFSQISIKHVRLDENERYKENVKSGINHCLNVEANLDQAATAFKVDLAMALFENGVAAIVPVDTTASIKTENAFDIHTMRVGEIISWYPQNIKVSVYSEQTGRRHEVILPKRNVGIVYNPLYSVMNEPNSTLQRLLRKLAILDAIDEQSGSGKLDVIIQLPYTIKSEARRMEAEKRRKDLEVQLSGSKYGIAYSDATEKITQLNRPAENNLFTQVKYLTEMLYSQLGITEGVMNGTADNATMLNYMQRAIVPFLDAVIEEMDRKFLTKTARSQGQKFMYFRDPFKLVPLTDLAEIADKFTRNEIMTSNEFRSVIGMKPADDPKADELRNSNMPTDAATPSATDSADADTQSAFDEIDSAIDGIFADLGVDEDAV